MKAGFLQARSRFISSLVLTLICSLLFLNFGFLAPLNLLEKILVSYNLFQWSYLLSLLHLIFSTHYKKIKERAIHEDENSSFVLVFSVIASALTFVAIAFELGSAQGIYGILKTVHLVLPAITLLGLWALLPTMYAIHYAHLYYMAKNEDKRPLRFPENPSNPDYFDFLYFSATIALTTQTSDVSVNSKRGRRLVLVQSILAFLFNTGLLALGINVTASLLR